MMLAAIEAMANADPVGPSRRHDADVAAQAARGEALHVRLLRRGGADYAEHPDLAAAIPLSMQRR
jgi:hypothetical protein